MSESGVGVGSLQLFDPGTWPTTPIRFGTLEVTRGLSHAVPRLLVPFTQVVSIHLDRRSDRVVHEPLYPVSKEVSTQALA